MGQGAHRPPSFWTATAVVFDLALGQMLWSRRSLLLALVVAGPVLVALAVRLAAAAVASGVPPIDDIEVAGPVIFGLIVWLLFVKFVVPMIAVFYGTALIADEVEEGTITYLLVRPVPRAAVLFGKYAAYLVCSAALVLPALVLVYVLTVPVGGGRLGGVWPLLVVDLGAVVAGLAAYGAVFALVGASLRRPLAVGLAFIFAWEPVVQVLPGYLKRLTVGHYLQALVPPVSLGAEDQGLLAWLSSSGSGPGALVSLGVLTGVSLTALALASWIFGQREYVLDR